jgi:hypothetical protein
MNQREWQERPGWKGTFRDGRGTTTDRIQPRLRLDLRPAGRLRDLAAGRKEPGGEGYAATIPDLADAVTAGPLQQMADPKGLAAAVAALVAWPH